MQMLILIKREIEDHLAYFISAVILSALMVVLCVLSGFRLSGDDNQGPVIEIGLSIPVVAIAIICLTGMGTSQMYNDKNNRISAFLSTLPTSRAGIITARITAGLLMTVVMVLPVVIAGHILTSILIPNIPIVAPMFFDIAVTVFLMCLACYCIGLQTGWTSSRLTPTLVAIILSYILLPLIFIKGFGVQIDIILVLFVIASLARTWCKFSSVSL